MDKRNNIIERIIKLNNGSCPEFSFENPLIDKNVARALSRSIIKVIANPEHSIVNAKLKSAILTYLRKICFVESNEDVVEEALNSFISENSESDDEEVTGKKSDTFLMKNFNFNIKSKYKSKYEPELVQALLNLRNNVEWLEKDLLFWDEDKKSNAVLKNLWLNENITDEHDNIINNMSIKYIPFIEEIILSTCTKILTKPIDIEEILSSQDFLNLSRKSSASSNCFQITTNILNYVLIKSEFNVKILDFIRKFILKVKLFNERISVLYPRSIQSTVLLLNIDFNEIPSNLMTFITTPVFESLNKLQMENEHDLILVLSHYPCWFDLYTKHKGSL